MDPFFCCLCKRGLKLNIGSGALRFRCRKKVFDAPTSWKQGCQMVCFRAKNHNLGKFWRALDWKKFIYFMTIWNILWPFSTFCIRLVHFSGFGIVYREKSGNPGWQTSRKYPQVGQLLEFRQCPRRPGANSTAASYNASVVKIYNSATSDVRFKTKICSSTCSEKTLQPTATLAGVVDVNSEVVGLGPGKKFS
jgi:hypothetical protein